MHRKGGLVSALFSPRFQSLVKLQNLHQYLKTPLLPSLTATNYFDSHCSPVFSSIFRRPISISAQLDRKIVTHSTDSVECKKIKKPLDALFKEAIGFSERFEQSESEDESQGVELKQKMRKLEEELRSLKRKRKKNNSLKLQTIDNESLEKLQNKDDGARKECQKKDDGDLESKSKPKSLYSLFADTDVKHDEKSQVSDSLRMEDPVVYKEISPDLATFLRHLYDEGYFKNANFLPGNKFDVACFESSYCRDFIKFATEEFGKDNQEIAKWLSGSDLKKVALFGCPSLARKSIFSAKRLRIFFSIQEDSVCSKCALKQDCKFKNQSVWKGDTKTLNLAVVMRVIILYALESVPPQLFVPEEVKAAVSRLLKEVLNLSHPAA